jgi:hypothetical protein
VKKTHGLWNKIAMIHYKRPRLVWHFFAAIKTRLAIKNFKRKWGVPCILWLNGPYKLCGQNMTSVDQQLFLLKKIPGKGRIGLPSGASRRTISVLMKMRRGNRRPFRGLPKFDLSRMLGLWLWGMGV